MSAPNCPHCGNMTEADFEFSDFACPDCGLAGPGDVLDALAKRETSHADAHRRASELLGLTATLDEVRHERDVLSATVEMVRCKLVAYDVIDEDIRAEWAPRVLAELAGIVPPHDGEKAGG